MDLRGHEFRRFVEPLRKGQQRIGAERASSYCCATAANVVPVTRPSSSSSAASSRVSASAKLLSAASQGRRRCQPGSPGRGRGCTGHAECWRRECSSAVSSCSCPRSGRQGVWPARRIRLKGCRRGVVITECFQEHVGRIGERHPLVGPLWLPNRPPPPMPFRCFGAGDLLLEVARRETVIGFRVELEVLRLRIRRIPRAPPLPLTVAVVVTDFGGDRHERDHVASSSRRRARDTAWTSRAICSRVLRGLSANQTKLIAQPPYSPRYNRHDVPGDLPSGGTPHSQC